MAENLHFAIKLNNEALKKDAKESQNIIKGVADEATVEGEKMEKSFNRVGGAVAALFTAQKASMFIRSMVQIRGEFQQLEIAFSTMLRSGEKADKLMADLTKFAGETPFGLQSSANAARQLIAYGSAAETVIDELTMLGDVAAGTGTQIGDLVYLYGTLRTQGKAYTMDIRQFAGRGIPIYDELANVLGVAKNQVMDLVTAGKVGFPEVEKAFKNMTASGSMYGGLMEKQSKSVTGRIEELKDAIDVMFNEIGRSNEGITYKVISTASLLVENYEKVGKIIMELVAAYGTYRAVLISISAIEQLNMKIARQAVLEKRLALMANIKLSNAEAVAAARTKILTIAKQGLGKTLKSLATALTPNPYVLAATAVAGLTFAVYKLATADSAAEIATKSLSRAQEERAKATEEERSKTEDLMSSLKDETLTRRERKTILNELQKIYPSIFSNLDIESAKYIDIADKIKEVNGLLEQKTRSQLVHEINTTQELLDRLKSGNIMSFRERGEANQILGLGWGESLTIEANEMIKALEKHLSGLKRQEDDILIASFNAVTNEEKRNRLIIQRNELQEKYNNKLNEEKSVWGDDEFAKSVELQMMEKSILRLNSEIKKYGDTVVNTITKNKAYWEEEKKNAEEALGLLTSENTAKEWADARAKVAKAQAELAKYSLSGSGSQSGQTKKDSYIFDVQREEGIKKIQEDVKAFFDARRKANLEGVKAERQAEEEARVEYLIQWGNFEQKRIALIDKYELEASKAKTKAEKDGLLKSLEQSLKGLTSDELKSGGMFSKMFEDFEKLSTKSLNDILDLDQYIDQLDLSIEETKIFKEAILKARSEIEQRNPFKLLTNSWEDFIKALKSGDSDAIKSAVKGLEDGVQNVMSFATDVGNSVGSIFSSFGNDKVGEDINNILAIAGGAGQAAVGVGKLASGDIIGGVKDLAKGISDVVGGIVRMNDAVKEREIQKLQKQLEVLEESYNNLSKAIDKAYSGTAANLIRENEKLLQQQKAIIQKQLEAEKSKKKTDKDAVKRYEQAIKDIDEELSKVEDSIVEVIFGKGVQSAIDQFAQAYADAFIAGEDAAEASAKVIEDLIKGALVGAMKDDLADLVDDWMKLYSNYISDGIIDSYEQSRLDSLEDEMNRIALKHKKGFDRFVEKEEEEEPEERQGAKKGFATASQDSINELNGRFTALQQTASYIQIDTGQISASTKKLTEITGLALNYLSNIDKHTAHLESIKAGISNMKSGIDDINLKGVRIR